MRFPTRSLFTGVLAVTAGVLSMGAVFTSQAAITWSYFTNTDSDGNPNTGTYASDGTLPSGNIGSASLSIVNSGLLYPDAITPGGRINLNNGGINAVMTFTLVAASGSGGARISSLGFDLIGYQAGQPNKIDWTYNIVGGSSGNLDPASTSLTGSATYSHILNSPITIGGGQTINIVGTLSSGTTTSPLYFDNFAIGVTAVPEPVNMALAGFGLVAAGVGVGRRLCKKSRE